MGRLWFLDDETGDALDPRDFMRSRPIMSYADGMGGSNKMQPQQATSTTSAPWEPIQPYLKTLPAEFQNLYQNDIGYDVYTGPTQADLAPQSIDALLGTEWLARSDMAGGGDPLSKTAYNEADKQIRWGGIDEGMWGAMSPLRDIAYGTGMDPRMTSGNALSALEGFASGADRGTRNQHLLDSLAAGRRRISDDVSGLFSSAGRYGSGAMQGLMAQRMAEAEAPVLAEDYQRATDRMLQSANALSGIYDTALGRRLQSTGMQLDTMNAGRNRALQYAGLAPTLNEQRYSPFARLAGVGDLFTQRDQNEINAIKEAFNAAQARPWEQAFRLSAGYQGLGGLGGTQTGSRSVPTTSPWLRGIGGAATGASLGSMFGPFGAGAGGLLGAGLGLFA